MVLARHLAAFLAILSLCLGHVALCVGWQATPEARMACCTNDEATCPMHQGASHSDGVMVSQHTVDQAHADSCCAGSAGNESGTIAAGFAMATSFALVPRPFFALLPTLTFHIDGRRAAVPLPPSPVPKHLLLSVFLV
jgi:hypothetical protein